MALVRCRARVSSQCYGLKGRDEAGVYPDGDQREDGTWRPLDDTVVCDSCYIKLGQPLRADLERVVEEAQRRLGVEPI